MQIKEYLEKVCSEIKCKEVIKPISLELSNHIEEIKEECINNGMTGEKAEEYAVLQMGEPADTGKRLNKIHKPKLDWKLLILTIILISFGLIVTITKSIAQTDNTFIGKTTIGIVAGTILGTIVYFFDYRKLSKYSWVFLGIALVIHIMADLFGTNIYGINHLYINIGSKAVFSVAPYVISVPLCILAFIGLINKVKSKKDVIVLIGVALFSIAMMAKVPSMSSEMILALVYLIISTIKICENKEKRVKYLCWLYGILISLAILLVSYILIHSPYIIKRINPFDETSELVGYQASIRKDVMDNSVMIGKSNTNTKIEGFEVIENGTNYSFTLLILNYGWLLGIAVVSTIILMSVKLIINARTIKDKYGKYLIIGLSSSFILQSIFNVMINCNLWVETTMYLPFVSYGSISLVVNIICIALILSVYRRKYINLELVSE